MNLSIITPTCGRHSLRLVRDNVLDQMGENDQWIVVGDGYQPWTRQFMAIADSRVHYFETRQATNKFGNVQRDLGIKKADGDFLVFGDDDNLFPPGSLDIIRTAVAAAPTIPHLFAMQHGTETYLPREIACGRIGGPMLVPPNVPGLPLWGTFDDQPGIADFHWITAVTAMFPTFEKHDEIICLVRGCRDMD